MMISGAGCAILSSVTHSGGAMRMLPLVVGAICFAAISADQPLVLAQSNVPNAKPLVTTSPVSPPSVKFNLFLDSGTPVRPSTSMEIKEAGSLSTKKESERGKLDPSKIQPPGLLGRPNVTLDLTPPTAENNDRYKVEVRVPTITRENDGWARTKTSGEKKGSTKIDPTKIQPSGLLATPGRSTIKP
jgi:hypothetical protein